MENITQTPPVEQPPIQESVKPTPPSRVPLIILSVVTILSLSLSGYLYYQNTKSTTPPTPTPTSSPVRTPTPSPDSSKIQWRQTSFMGGYSFEYPNGWHVASQWPESTNEDGSLRVYIWIDPEPISGAPRGGPFSTIDIAEIGSTTNSESIFAQELERLRNNLENVTEEIISGNTGDIYHFTGIFPEGYLGGESKEAYILKIERPNDKINEKVIIVSAVGQKEYSDILKHIALGIAKLEF